MEKLHNIRHSLAHVLALAVLEVRKDAQRGVGPAIDDGFYYDFDFGDNPLKEEDLPKIEKRMQELVRRSLTFKKNDITPDEARNLFKDEPYKLELIDDFEKEGKELTTYTTADFTDLCKGGHVESTDEIEPDSFSLSRIAGAYWKGDEKNKMLTRIYGVAFSTAKEKDEYLKKQEEARERDHKKLGRELDLFYIDDEVGKGLPMWTPKGTAIKLAMEEFTRTLEKKYGYDHVKTPYLGSEKLYKKSGHLDHYAENMYAPIDMHGDIFYLRPMACPHHIQLLMRKPLSYRDLPVRYAEIADYNRFEKSGELMGMIRVRKFELTDAHIFVSPEGLKEEFKNVCRLISEGMEGLGLSSIISYRFSKRDPQDTEKYYQNDELWNKAESTMKEALDEIGFEYVEEEGEAAFYGPKLDVQARNVNGKEDTLFTAQIDFLLPEKFDITYTDKDGSEKRPVLIHRSAIGSLERTFAFLIEHFGGAFPMWLSPIQVSILPVAETHKDFAHEIKKMLGSEGVRVEVSDEDEKLGKRLRNVKLQKTPAIIVIGDNEIESGNIKVEYRDGTSEIVKKNDLASYIKDKASLEK